MNPVQKIKALQKEMADLKTYLENKEQEAKHIVELAITRFERIEKALKDANIPLS
jgi:hypothetical protein